MSAFHDLWIGNDNFLPTVVRSFNRNWTKQSSQSFSVWESVPVINRSIVSKYASAEYQLIVIGQFYEEVDLQQLLENCILFGQHRSERFSEPAGSYILFVIGKEDCYVFTDRFGTYHGYWLCDGQKRIISTFYWELVKQTSSSHIDWQSVGAFFSMGFFPGDKTYFDNIKIFNPASCYRFNKNLHLLSSFRYWDWEISETMQGITSYLADVDNALKTSLKYSLENRSTAIALSGGLDSRALSGVATAVNSSIEWAYSYGFADDSPEITIGRKIAAACSITYKAKVVPPYLFDDADIIVDAVELFQYIDGTRQACMREELEVHADTVLCGHWGDVWFDSLNIEDEMHSGALINAFRKKIVKKGSPQILSLFSDYIPDAGEYADAYFREYITKYSHIESPELKFKIFKTDQWSFRWTIASLRMYRAAVVPVLPFYDKRVADVLMRVPATLLRQRRLQVEYLKRYYSSLAKIKWQEYDNNLYQYKWLNNRNIFYRAASKLKRDLSKERRIIRNADLFYLNRDGEKKLRTVINETISGNLVPEAKVNALLDDYYKNPDAGNTYAISMLHTFARFIRKIS